MHPRSFCLLVALLSISAPLASISAAEPGAQIKRLDWLIGDWTFDDQQLAGDYRETGTRTCLYVLDQRYIRCESVGTSHTGKRREYSFYFGYNERDERFEMIGMTSSFPLQNLFTLTVSDDARQIDLTGHFFTGDGIKADNSATIVYNGHDQYVWSIRTGRPDPETGAHPVTFQDTATRVQK